MSAPFDTLKLARRLEAAGLPSQQAGDIAEAIGEATRDADLATTADLAPLATKADLAALAAATKLDIAEVKFDLVRWVVAMAIAQAGLVIAVLKLFPGNHPS